MEGDGSKEKVIESYGSLWKMQEQSIGKLGKHGRAVRSQVQNRKEKVM